MLDQAGGARRPGRAAGPADRRVGGLAWVLLLALALARPGWAGSVEVITHPGQTGEALDRSMVRALFSVRLRQWPNGTPVRVFVLPDNDPLHVQFCREKLGTFPYVLRASWDRMVYTGTGIAPEVVGSEREMRERIASTRGAIGYVSAADTAAASSLPAPLPPPAAGDDR